MFIWVHFDWHRGAKTSLEFRNLGTSYRFTLDPLCDFGKPVPLDFLRIVILVLPTANEIVKIKLKTHLLEQFFTALM